MLGPIAIGRLTMPAYSQLGISAKLPLQCAFLRPYTSYSAVHKLAVLIKPLEVGKVAKHLLPKHMYEAWQAEVRVGGGCRCKSIRHQLLLSAVPCILHAV